MRLFEKNFEDRKYYVEIYNKLMSAAEDNMLHRLNDRDYKTNINDLKKYLLKLFRESKISVATYNKLSKLIDSYKNI